MSEERTAEQHPNTSTAVARSERRPIIMGARGFDFDFEGIQRFAKGLIEGGMVPKGVTSPGAVVGLIEAGKELGLPPMYALANLTFTNGRLGIMGDAAKALIRRSGALESGTDFEEVYTGDEYTLTWTCTVSAHRKGQSARFSRSFSIANAVAARLVRLEGRAIKSRKGSEWIDHGPWSTYPQRMLMYRALGFLARDYFSDVLAGAVLTEELRDYATEPQRDGAPPPEPDPLLTSAPVTAMPRVDVEEAVVVPSTASDAGSPQPDEIAAIRAIEKLEGALVTATSRAELDRVWSEAEPLLQAVSAKQRKALTRLYEQNAAGFEPAIQATLEAVR